MLDTYALVELFRGGEKGLKVKKLLVKDNDIFVSVLSLFELGTVLDREIGEKRAEEYLRSIRTYYDLTDVDEKIALLACGLRRTYKLPAVDCMIYASAKTLSAKVVTGCKHFKKISRQKDVVII
jgi:predicted nucleic acid-binding protein